MNNSNDMGDIKVLEVGKVHKSFKNMPEGISCTFEENGFTLLITFNKPTKDEIEDIKNGRIQYAMLIKNDILIFLIKFGNQEWMDCAIPKEPYHEQIITKIENEKIGYAINIILADVPSGKVEVLRIVGLDHRFSNAFYKLMSLIKPMDKMETFRKALEVQKKYSTKDLLKLCLYKYIHIGN